MNNIVRLVPPALAVVAAISVPLTVQADPEFYGRVKVSLDHLSDYPDGSLFSQIDRVQVGDSPINKGWFVESNSSRLGVRGREPLDVGGLSVIYQLEVGYDVDGDSDTFSTRNSFVGLGTVAGDLFAGRYNSPVKIAKGPVDQFSNTAADIGHYFFGHKRRNSNSLNWKSPSLGEGLILRAQVVPGEGETSGNERKDGLADTFGLSATWTGNRLFAALAYEHGYQELSYLTPPAVDADLDLIRGTLGVNLGQVELGAMVEELRLDPDVSGAKRADATSYLLSAGWQVLPRVKLKAQASRFDGDDFDYESDIVTAGADYQLGGQTKLYGLVSSSDVDVTGPAGVDKRGSLVSAGVEHRF